MTSTFSEASGTTPPRLLYTNVLNVPNSFYAGILKEVKV